MKTVTVHDINEIAIYEGYSEMILQEGHKRFTTGDFSDVVYVSNQDQCYAYGELTFEKVQVAGVQLR